MIEAVKTGHRQFQIVCEDLPQVKAKIQEIIDRGLALCSISYISHEGQHCFFVLTKPVRRLRYTYVESVEGKNWFPEPMPLMREELPARQDGSAVLYRCVFRIPICLDDYIEIQLTGRRRDPGELV